MYWPRYPPERAVHGGGANSRTTEANPRENQHRQREQFGPDQQRQTRDNQTRRDQRAQLCQQKMARSAEAKLSRFGDVTHE